MRPKANVVQAIKNGVVHRMYWMQLTLSIYICFPFFLRMPPQVFGPSRASHKLLLKRIWYCTYFCSANQSWPLVLNDLDWFIAHGNGKKMYFDEVCGTCLRPLYWHLTIQYQNGWPSVTSPSVQPNSPLAVSDVANEQVYTLSIFPRSLQLSDSTSKGIFCFTRPTLRIPQACSRRWYRVVCSHL